VDIRGGIMRKNIPWVLGRGLILESVFIVVSVAVSIKQKKVFIKFKFE